MSQIVFQHLAEALLLSLSMVWQVLWSLILGFTLSATIEATVSKERMQQALGKNGIREVALATFFGAVSSSCSYAAAATSKTLFKKGAALIPSLAFLFASTNLVIELGIILFLLMGWQFTLAEWIGGIVLVLIMSLLVKLTYPKKLVEEARSHVDAAQGHTHQDMLGEGDTAWKRLLHPKTRILIAQNFLMDWTMLQKDLILGFIIAGVIAVFVPQSIWNVVLLTHAPASVQTFASVLIGPIIAVLSFVCSIGNVPLAAVLWSKGLSFGGVLAFLYADLIVIPLLDVYRRYYGWKMAAYIGIVFFVIMALTGLIMAMLFGMFHAIPAAATNVVVTLTTFSFNYTFWLNILFGALAIYFIYLNRKYPMHTTPSCCKPASDMPRDKNHGSHHT